MELNVAQLWLSYPKEQIKPIEIEEFYLKNDPSCLPIGNPFELNPLFREALLNLFYFNK